jgi:hypothetical protein
MLEPNELTLLSLLKTVRTDYNIGAKGYSALPARVDYHSYLAASILPNGEYLLCDVQAYFDGKPPNAKIVSSSSSLLRNPSRKAIQVQDSKTWLWGSVPYAEYTGSEPLRTKLSFTDEEVRAAIKQFNDEIAFDAKRNIAVPKTEPPQEKKPFRLGQGCNIYVLVSSLADPNKWGREHRVPELLRLLPFDGSAPSVALEEAPPAPVPIKIPTFARLAAGG